MKAGSWEIAVIEAESFRLDGGAMFGVVPKPLWSRIHAADERNRIRMVTRCLIARGAGRTVLVDTGMGSQWSENERDMYAIEDGDRTIVASLRARGIEPDDVTDVILTHLHFDHAGGAVTRLNGSLQPAFPEAMYHVQEDQLRWALNPTQRDRRSYRPNTFVPLRDAGRIALVRGAAEVLPGVRVEPTHGHTAGHQVVIVGEGRGSVMYCGDLIPTAAHIPAPWVMGYDLHPLTTMREKHALLSRAADEGWVIVLEHDPAHVALTVGRQGDGFAAAQAVAIA